MAVIRLVRWTKGGQVIITRERGPLPEGWSPAQPTARGLVRGIGAHCPRAGPPSRCARSKRKLASESADLE